MPSEGNFNFEPGKNKLQKDTGNPIYDATVENMRQDNVHYLEQMMDFRYKIQTLSHTKKQSHLEGINVDKLTDLDFVVFQKFEKGTLTKAQAEKELELLRRPGALETAQNSRKLLNYILIEILKKKTKPRSKQIGIRFT